MCVVLLEIDGTYDEHVGKVEGRIYAELAK